MPPSAVLESALAALAGLEHKPVGSASDASIIFTVWNTMMGSTLLVMPFCFAISGWALGLALMALVAVVSKYTTSIILRRA